MSLSTILVSVKLCLSSESTLVTRSRDLTLSPPKGIWDQGGYVGVRPEVERPVGKEVYNLYAPKLIY